MHVDGNPKSFVSALSGNIDICQTVSKISENYRRGKMAYGEEYMQIYGEEKGIMVGGLVSYLAWLQLGG